MATRYGSVCSALKLIASYLFRKFPLTQRYDSLNERDHLILTVNSFRLFKRELDPWRLRKTSNSNRITVWDRITPSEYANFFTVDAFVFTGKRVEVCWTAPNFWLSDIRVWHPRLRSTLFLTQFSWMHARKAKLQDYQGRKQKNTLVALVLICLLKLLYSTMFKFSEVWQIYSTYKIFVLSLKIS